MSMYTYAKDVFLTSGRRTSAFNPRLPSEVACGIVEHPSRVPVIANDELMPMQVRVRVRDTSEDTLPRITDGSLPSDFVALARVDNTHPNLVPTALGLGIVGRQRAEMVHVEVSELGLALRLGGPDLLVELAPPKVDDFACATNFGAIVLGCLHLSAVIGTRSVPGLTSGALA